MDSSDDIKARLSITVLRGRNLPAKDRNGTSDPYCLITTDTQSVQTEVVPKNLNPVWNKSFTLNVLIPFPEIMLEVWDDNKIGRATWMGQFKIHLEDYSDKNPHQKWFPLEVRKLGESTSGEIELKLHYKYVDDWNVHYKGAAALKNGQYAQAVAELSSAIVTSPRSEQLYSFRSAAFLALGDVEKSHQDAIRCLEIHPNWYQGLLRLGKVYQEAGNPDKAEESFNRGIAQNPCCSDLQKALADLKAKTTRDVLQTALEEGKAAFKATDFEQAVRSFTTALSHYPRSTTVILYRAISYVAMDNIPKATDEAQKILHIDPQWPEVNARLSGFLEKSGKIHSKMRRRWFILKNVFLFYYKDQGDTSPQGIVVLSSFRVIPQRERAFKIETPKRTFEIRCSDKAQREKWVEALRELSSSELVLPTDETDDLLLYETSLKREKARNLRAQLHKLQTVKIVSNVTKRLDSALSTVTIINPDKAGWLDKEGEINKEWQQRWFVLKDHYLNYFKDEQDPNPTDVSPKGTIELTGCTVNPCSLVSFTFDITTVSRVYRLRADTREDYIEWIRLMMTACGQHEDYKKLEKTFTIASAKPEVAEVKQQPEKQKEDTSPRRSTIEESVPVASIPTAGLTIDTPTTAKKNSEFGQVVQPQFACPSSLTGESSVTRAERNWMDKYGYASFDDSPTVSSRSPEQTISDKTTTTSSRYESSAYSTDMPTKRPDPLIPPVGHDAHHVPKGGEGTMCAGCVLF